MSSVDCQTLSERFLTLDTFYQSRSFIMVFTDIVFIFRNRLYDGRIETKKFLCRRILTLVGNLFLPQSKFIFSHLFNHYKINYIPCSI